MSDDTSKPERRRSWKFILIPTLAMLFFAAYPQLNLWLAKGSVSDGAYFVTNYDEVAYSAYVNSLINGDPRKNDPFTRTAVAESESLYSIQFIPAYAIALPARFIGISASTAFIILNLLIALFSALAIFVFLRAVTDDELFAGAGVLIVLCFGTAAAFQGEIRHLLSGSVIVDFFPFLRRYQPGFAFPIFFVFCLSVWRSFTELETRKAAIYTVISGVAFAVLVFSYFYLWTGGLAWLACLSILWLAARKDEWARISIRLGGIALIGLAALVPYFYLLSNRSKNTDDTQLLSYTRVPDLLAPPELIGFCLIAVIVYFVVAGKLRFVTPAVLLTLSMAITPFVLLNQQIITGRSLQPLHYEIFIANYLVLGALVLTIWLIKGSYETSPNAGGFRKLMVYFGVAAVLWGFVESTATARRYGAYEDLRAAAMPALDRLPEQTPEGAVPVAVSTNLMVADFIPTATPLRSLWNPHTNSAGGVTSDENKQLLFHYLYYSGFDENDLAKAIDSNLFEIMSGLFGGGRALIDLETGSRPVTANEKEAAIREFRDFRMNFDRSKASSPELSYIIVPTKAEPDYREIDRWYQRGPAETFGLFKVYTLKLKP
ncbi:MAG TPA: hypothetical protein VK468_08340 [Pyrinomonadaceae bacterium]|nr:hypothetical protein [Pyrinomonadaceae bacterium]